MGVKSLIRNGFGLYLSSDAFDEEFAAAFVDEKDDPHEYTQQHHWSDDRCSNESIAGAEGRWILEGGIGGLVVLESARAQKPAASTPACRLEESRKA
jgi:hypothetical protein